MSKQTNPARTCTDCTHCLACHLWSNCAISNSVAPKCPQFKPARYASLAELQDLYGMHKGELVPVLHGRWVFDSGVDYCYKCSECRYPAQFCHGSGIEQELTKYCPHCGAKMDKKEEL